MTVRISIDWNNFEEDTLRGIVTVHDQTKQVISTWKVVVSEYSIHHFNNKGSLPEAHRKYSEAVSDLAHIYYDGYKKDILTVKWILNE